MNARANNRSPKPALLNKYVTNVPAIAISKISPLMSKINESVACPRVAVLMPIILIIAKTRCSYIASGFLCITLIASERELAAAVQELAGPAPVAAERAPRDSDFL